MQYITIGQHHAYEKSVATGPYRTYKKAWNSATHLEGKGWTTEIIELMPVDQIGSVNDEEDY